MVLHGVKHQNQARRCSGTGGPGVLHLRERGEREE